MEIRFGLEELGLTRGNRRIGFNFRRARLEDNRWAHYDWQPVRSEDSGPVFGTLILPKTGFN